MHPANVFLYLLSSFILGISLGSFVALPEILLTVIIILGITLVGISWRRNWQVVRIGLFLLLFVFGIIRINTISVDHQILKTLASQEYLKEKNQHISDIIISGYIDNTPYIRNAKQYIFLKAKEATIGNKIITLKEKILLISEAYPKYTIGQAITAQGKIEIPKNTESFDYQAYLAKDQIGTLMNYPKIENVELSFSIYEKCVISFFRSIGYVRDEFTLSIAKALPEPHAALLIGILLGGTDTMPASLRESFRKTGTSHILAVSGYNVTIIAEIILLFLLFFLKRQKAFYFALFGIFCFAILTGAEASIIRAAIMGVIVLVARQQGRMYDARNALILAGFIMLYFNPQLLRYDIGFQLSFVATIGLLYLSPVCEIFFNKLCMPIILRKIVTPSIAAQLAVLPLIISQFGLISLVALPVNILITPLIPFAMLFGFIVGSIGILSSGMAHIFSPLAWLISKIIISIVHYGGSFSWSTMTISLPSWGAFIIYVIGIILFLRFRHKLQKV